MLACNSTSPVPRSVAGLPHSWSLLYTLLCSKPNKGPPLLMPHQCMTLISLVNQSRQGFLSRKSLLGLELRSMRVWASIFPMSCNLRSHGNRRKDNCGISHDPLDVWNLRASTCNLFLFNLEAVVFLSVVKQSTQLFALTTHIHGRPGFGRVGLHCRRLQP